MKPNLQNQPELRCCYNCIYSCVSGDDILYCLGDGDGTEPEVKPTEICVNFELAETE